MRQTFTKPLRQLAAEYRACAALCVTVARCSLRIGQRDYARQKLAEARHCLDRARECAR